MRECVHVSNQSQIENESPEVPVVGELFGSAQTSLSELRLQLAHAQVNRGGCCTLFSNTRSHCVCDKENVFEWKQARGTCSKYMCETSNRSTGEVPLRKCGVDCLQHVGIC